MTFFCELAIFLIKILQQNVSLTLEIEASNCLGWLIANFIIKKRFAPY